MEQELLNELKTILADANIYKQNKMPTVKNLKAEILEEYAYLEKNLSIDIEVSSSEEKAVSDVDSKKLILALSFILFVNELNNIEISGVKLGYWFAQQGSIYVFIILVFIYIKLMMNIDKKYGFNE